MIMLLGAKKFLDMPKGTIYARIDISSNAKKIINNFKNNRLSINFENLEIYGDNTGSLIYDNYEDLFGTTEKFCNNYSYVDINVVGDATPTDTLYFIISEDFLETNFSKSEIKNLLNARDEFIRMFIGENKPLDNRLDEINNWARKELEQLSQFYEILELEIKK